LDYILFITFSYQISPDEKKVFEINFPGQKLEIKHKIEITDQIQKTLSAELGLQISAEGGIDLKGINAKISRQLNAKLGYNVTNTTTITKEDTNTETLTNTSDATRTYTHYAKQITLTLRRMDGKPAKSYTYDEATISRVL
jgi:hypothetical protein